MFKHSTSHEHASLVCTYLDKVEQKSLFWHLLENHTQSIYNGQS